MPKDMRLLFLIGGVIGFMLITFLIAIFLAPSPSTLSPSPSPLSSVFYGVDRDIIINPNYSQPSITPYTPQNDYSPQYVEKSVEIENSEKSEREKGQQVGKLLSLVPYKGTYFSISFDYETVDFVVELDKAHLPEANQEFDTFLLKNGIQNRNWIKNLVIN